MRFNFNGKSLTAGPAQLSSSMCSEEATEVAEHKPSKDEEIMGIMLLCCINVSV